MRSNDAFGATMGVLFCVADGDYMFVSVLLWTILTFSNCTHCYVLVACDGDRTFVLMLLAVDGCHISPNSWYSFRVLVGFK